MGFLAEGKALEWSEAKKLAQFIRNNGIEQFLSVFNAARERNGDVPLWGDELEYLVIKFDPEKRTATISLRAHEILPILQEEEKEDAATAETLWRPEYGSFMLEATPGKPYTMDLEALLGVEKNMILRRLKAQKILQENEFIFLLTSFPMLGVGSYSTPAPDASWKPGSDFYTRSLFIQDQIINHHPRFRFLSANIRERRGKTVDINIPLFHDHNTRAPQYGPVHDPTASDESIVPPPGALPDSIYMDAMGFGMGCSCLQTTFQAKDITEARKLYDQFGVLTPIFLALTASAPIFRGYLADTDVRWNVISSSVDDRTEEERGLKPLSSDRFVINKSRYASFSLYISDLPALKDEFNDLNAPFDPKVFQHLLSKGLDERLAKHFAHLFIRDPLVIYDNRIEIDNSVNSDHFENIQSTNWQTVRFKPPPPNSNIGWRVEFRSMDIQLTEFENAAFAVFLVLLNRIILKDNLNLYIPLSKVDDNMDKAHHRDAVLNERFWFRSNLHPDPESPQDDRPLELMTVNEIINGKEGLFEGLIPLCKKYLDEQPIENAVAQEARNRVDQYLLLISKRASGELITAARWIRNFVDKHPAYKHDSVVSHEVNFDLLQSIHQIIQGEVDVPELLLDRSVWFQH
eukprot:TRINITY_DN2879_c0_g1_i1.p1 TRINITY_DN2879_c0_g1~~TRINITY_DN2879_c0_g1_i1.p1  ORF type:complete len:719 (-),score=276.59 TRINITY_DN2879_c0_g1_i1:225-2120(-)